MKRFLCAVALLVAAGWAHAGWDYEDQTDKMTSKRVLTASVRSSNSLDLAFPYRGENYGWLTVRKHPAHGLDVILQVSKGQIQCSAHFDCQLLVKFDDAPPVKFKGMPPEDHTSTIVFISNTKSFLQKAAKARRILIQPTFFKNGAPILTFDTPEPLVWPPKSP